MTFASFIFFASHLSVAFTSPVTILETFPKKDQKSAKTGGPRTWTLRKRRKRKQT